jgi:hypothetical protein
MVTVDARASRLRSLESVLLPGIEQRDAWIQVPRHYPVQTRRAGVALSDGEALLLTLPSPEPTGRVIVVKVRVKRLQ